MITLTTSQYQIEDFSSWHEYVAKIEKLVIAAKTKQTQLLLFPEYAGIEIALKNCKLDIELFQTVQLQLSNYIDFFSQLAQKYQIYLQPGTVPVKINSQYYVNRAYFFGPKGNYGYQDKLQLIEFEKQSKLLQPGSEQTLFATDLGKIGIAICYDSEFPEIVRRFVYAGADLILVPSYTTSMEGYFRVFLSCRARALENQCYVVSAAMVNQVNTGGEIENTFGSAGFFGPVDQGFPSDGIIMQGNLNEVVLITASLDMSKLAWVRQQGQVRNLADAKMAEACSIQTKKLF